MRPAPGERASDGTWRLRGQFSPAADADADAQADATGEVSGRRVAVLDPAGTVVAADRTDPRGGFTIDVRGPVHAVVIESGVGGFVAEGLAIG